MITSSIGNHFQAHQTPMYGATHTARVLGGHLGSSLVAMSVLFGSMFAAHSALVQVNVDSILSSGLGFVYETRSIISSIPEKAAAHMQVVHENYEQQGLATAYQAEISSSLSGINLGTILTPGHALSVDIEPFVTIPPDYGINLDISGNSISNESVPSDMGILALSLGESIRDNGQAGLRASAAAWAGVVPDHYALSDRLTIANANAIEAFIRGSHVVSKTLILSAYTVGDTLIRGLAIGIPEFKSAYAWAIGTWVEQTPHVARQITAQQIAFGDKVLSSMEAIRKFSARSQEALGVEIATASERIGAQAAGLVSEFTLESTASLGNFLILEPE